MSTKRPTLVRKALLLLALAAPALPAELTVTVSDIKDEKGEVACALFRSADGFPMEGSKATLIRLQAKPGSVECKFEKVEPGSYAVSVSVDRNKNGKTDKNLFGIPTEPWGVSNNVRPGMRAPRYQEAVFQVKDEPATRIEVKVAQ